MGGLDAKTGWSQTSCIASTPHSLAPMRTLSVLTLLLLSGCSSVTDAVRDAAPAGDAPWLWPEAYARSAVNQNQTQLDLGCGFSSGQGYWSDSYDGHRSWATRNSVERRRDSYEYRETNLATCRARLGS